LLKAVEFKHKSRSSRASASRPRMSKAETRGGSGMAGEAGVCGTLGLSLKGWPRSTEESSIRRKSHPVIDCVLLRLTGLLHGPLKSVGRFSGDRQSYRPNILQSMVYMNWVESNRPVANIDLRLTIATIIVAETKQQ